MKKFQNSELRSPSLATFSTPTQQEFILLENLTYKYKYPCVLGQLLNPSIEFVSRHPLPH